MLQNQLIENIEDKLSTQTLRNRLHESQLRAKRLARVLSLSCAKRKQDGCLPNE